MDLVAIYNTKNVTKARVSGDREPGYQASQMGWGWGVRRGREAATQEKFLRSILSGFPHHRLCVVLNLAGRG